MKWDIANLLSKIFVFANLSEIELNQLAKMAKIKRLKKGEWLFSQGEKADVFYLLIMGRVVVFKNSLDGGEKILHLHQSGELIAEAAIFDQQSYPASAKTAEHSLVITIPKCELLKLLASNQQLALKMLAAYSRRLREFVEMVEYLSLDDVRSKLIKYFERNSFTQQNKLLVKISFSKKDWASMLGIRPETLSRQLRQMETEGLIKQIEKGMYCLPKHGRDKL